MRSWTSVNKFSIAVRWTWGLQIANGYSHSTSNKFLLLCVCSLNQGENLKQRCKQNKTNHLQSNAGPCSLYMIGRLHSGFEADSLHHKNCLYTRSSDTQSHTLDTRLRHHSRSLVEWDCHSMGFVLIFHANVRANQKSKKNSATWWDSGLKITYIGAFTHCNN